MDRIHSKSEGSEFCASSSVKCFALFCLCNVLLLEFRTKHNYIHSLFRGTAFQLNTGRLLTAVVGKTGSIISRVLYKDHGGVTNGFVKNVMLCRVYVFPYLTRAG